MRHHFPHAFILLLLSVLLFRCTTDQPETTSSVVTAEDIVNSEAKETSSLLAKVLPSYLDQDATNYLLRLHAAFTKGVQTGLKNRSDAFAYEQNQLKIRQQVFDQQTINHLFPFSEGQLRLGNIGETSELALFSDQCSFASDSTDLVVRYTCLSKDESFLSYLNEQAASSSIITGFVESYRASGMITDGIKQSLILSKAEGIDFNNPHHQLFYALFQLLLVEEMEARKDFMMGMNSQ